MGVASSKLVSPTIKIKSVCERRLIRVCISSKGAQVTVVSIDQLSVDPKWIGSGEIADDSSVRDQSLTVP